MLPFYGKPSNLEAFPATTPKNLRRGTATLILRGQNEDQLTPKSESSNIRSQTLLRREEKLQINVSGRRYEISLQQLRNFPKSLLADPAKRELYYDAENDEIFFDRNRTTFESVYYFYATSGMLVFPTKTFCQQLVADELHFFGLYNYLSPEEKHYSLPLPTAVSEKRVSPRGTCQKKVWESCEIPESSPIARITNLFSLVVIVFAVVILCIETLPSVQNLDSGQDISNTRTNQSLEANRNTSQPTYNTTPHALKYFISRAEEFCMAWFTVELLARFVISPEKRRFLLRFLNVVDVAAILPFYISLIASTSHTVPIFVIKIFHLSKIFRVLKISRYISTMKVLGKTARACLYDLWTVVSLTFIGTILFGIIVYYCEQWDKTTEFHSIPEACWWAVVTITTLGYGDLVPNTLGKCKIKQISSF